MFFTFSHYACFFTLKKNLATMTPWHIFISALSRITLSGKEIIKDNDFSGTLRHNIQSMHLAIKRIVNSYNGDETGMQPRAL